MNSVNIITVMPKVVDKPAQRRAIADAAIQVIHLGGLDKAFAFIEHYMFQTNPGQLEYHFLFLRSNENLQYIRESLSYAVEAVGFKTRYVGSIETYGSWDMHHSLW